MKTWKKTLILFLIMACAIGFTYYDANYISPRNYTVRNEDLHSTLIPEQLDNMNIIFFSDVEYGKFMDETRLNKLVDTINSLGPDVILFGGDLYEDTISPTGDMNHIIASAFQKLKASYGKFAVYGDNDNKTEEALNATNEIYRQADFEVLSNTSISLHKGGSQSITLVGLDNGINNTQDIQTAYLNVSKNNYVITLCHDPDTADLVPADLTNYFLAGHTHGGQVYYLFGALYTPSSAINYFRGKQLIKEEFTLDITNGTGTTIQDMRLLANAEIVDYHLIRDIPEEKKDSQKLKTNKHVPNKKTEQPDSSGKGAQ